MLLSFIFSLMGYIIGSIPFGLVLVKLIHQEDIREFGSSNIGATNVWRRGYKCLAILTFLLDAGKAFIIMFLVTQFTSRDSLIYLSGLFVVIGHIYSIFLNFKGGKGIATFMGFLIFINPILASINAFLWLISFKKWRYSSLSAIIMLIVTVFYTLIFYNDNFIKIILICASLLILWKHKDNIKRLINHNELKL